MRTILLLAIIWLHVSFPLLAQQTMYVSECGGHKTTITWREERKGEKIYLYTTEGNDKHEYVLDNSFQTESWKVTSPLTHTHLNVILKGGKYSITGTFQGKRVSRTIASKGHAWYQNIAFNVWHTLKNKSSVKYECFRPDNLKLYTMIASIQGKEDFEGIRATNIKVSLTGFLSAFWSCCYYFDPITSKFIGYKGVNGAPGTPETTIKIIP